MTIDVIKAMGLTQPQAVERSTRTAEGAPFAELLDRPERPAPSAPPARTSRRELAADARPSPAARNTPEGVDGRKPEATDHRPEPEVARETRTAHEAEASVAQEEQPPSQTAAEAPLRKAAKQDGATPPEASLAQAAEADSAGGIAQPGETADGASGPVGPMVLASGQPGDGAALQSPPAAGAAAPDTSVIPLDAPLVRDTLVPAPLVQSPQGEAAATTLAAGMPNGLTKAVAGTDSPAQAPSAVPSQAASAAGGAGAAAALASATTNPGAEAGQGVASQSASGPNASGPNGAGQQAQFVLAEGSSDAVTVRVAGPAFAQPAAVGSPLIAPGTVLAAMSADKANPARAGEPAPSGAPQASGEEDGAANSAFKPAVPTAGQGMAPAAQAGGQVAANNKATAEVAGGTVPTTAPATAPATGQAATAGLADPTLGGSQPAANNPAAPPAPPAHPRWAAPVQTPASQVGARLAAQAGDGSRSYDIQLDPANLGRVRVHLDVGKDGAVTASISADRSDTLMMLRSDARTLQQALQDAGLSTTAGSLEFSLSGQRRDGGAWGGGTGGNLQALRDDSTGESRQADITPSAISPTGRPGRGSRAVDLKV